MATSLHPTAEASPVRAAESSFALRAEPASLGSPVDAAPEAPQGVLIRDARLDEYLAAHQQFGGGAALGMPAGMIRRAAQPEFVIEPGAR